MRKYIVAIVFVLILILIILGIRSCEPRMKPGAGDPYYQPFINASVEYVCTVYNDINISPDSDEAKSLLNDIYRKYELPVDDNDTMLEIFQKYENNEEMAQTIEDNLNDCSDFN